MPEADAQTENLVYEGKAQAVIEPEQAVMSKAREGVLQHLDKTDLPEAEKKVIQNFSDKAGDAALKEYQELQAQNPLKFVKDAVERAKTTIRISTEYTDEVKKMLEGKLDFIPKTILKWTKDNNSNNTKYDNGITFPLSDRNILYGGPPDLRIFTPFIHEIGAFPKEEEQFGTWINKQREDPETKVKFGSLNDKNAPNYVFSAPTDLIGVEARYDYNCKFGTGIWFSKDRIDQMIQAIRAPKM